jgi:hypothetical protein
MTVGNMTFVNKSEHNKVICYNAKCNFKKPWYLWMKDINLFEEKCIYCGSSDIVIRNIDPLGEKIFICKKCIEKMKNTIMQPS